MYVVFCLQIRPPPRSTLTDTHFPYPTLVRSPRARGALFLTTTITTAATARLLLGGGRFRDRLRRRLALRGGLAIEPPDRLPGQFLDIGDILGVFGGDRKSTRLNSSH